MIVFRIAYFYRTEIYLMKYLKRLFCFLNSYIFQLKSFLHNATILNFSVELMNASTNTSFTHFNLKHYLKNFEGIFKSRIFVSEKFSAFMIFTCKYCVICTGL